MIPNEAKGRSIPYVAMSILLAAVGGFLAAGYGGDDRELAWTKRHLKVIPEQLSVLKTHLVRYNEVHGRYPTNDEGLAALDNFETRLDMHLFRMIGAGENDVPSSYYTSPGKPWGMRKDMVRGFRAQKGGRGSEARVSLKYQFSDWLEFEGDQHLPKDREVTTVTMAISDQNDIFPLSPAGVLSPWWLPYTYENRVGLDVAKFEGSPANDDPKRLYSIRVDEGIYLCAVDGKEWVAEANRQWWVRNGPRCLGGVMLFAAVGLLVAATRVSKGRIPVIGAVLALFFAGMGVAANNLPHATCYVMSPLFSRRTPQMAVRQKALLDAYHSRGVISNAVYQRSVAALAVPVTTRPASAPGGR